MANDVTIFTKNILEDATVTITGDADTGYPESRVYDRCASLFWKDTSTVAITFQADQSSTALVVNTLFVEGHNFDGLTMHWEYSSDASSWVNACDSWAQSGNGQIVKTASAATAITKTHWRVTLSTATNPKCGEIYMSRGYTFNALLSPAPVIAEADNVQWNRTVGGVERATKFGEVRKQRTYTLCLTTAELVNFRAAMDDLDEYSKPFYIKDHEDSYFLCRLLSVPVEEIHSEVPDYTLITLEVIETL